MVETSSSDVPSGTLNMLFNGHGRSPGWWAWLLQYILQAYYGW